jgi:hypothetical protein
MGKLNAASNDKASISHAAADPGDDRFLIAK